MRSVCPLWKRGLPWTAPLDREGKRAGAQKSNHHDWLLQFQDVPLFPTLYPIRSALLHLYPPRPTHPTLAPHGGSYPGESITDEGAHGGCSGGAEDPQVAGLGVARGAVELGSASGTRPARDRRRHRRRRTSLSLRLAAVAATAANSRPPPLTRILCSPRCLSLSLLQRHAVSFPRTDIPKSLLSTLLDGDATFHRRFRRNFRQTDRIENLDTNFQMINAAWRRAIDATLFRF